MVLYQHHVLFIIAYPFQVGGEKLALIDHSYLVSTVFANAASMDTFMVVSGLFVGSFLMTRERIVLWKFCLKRYMRLMPTVLFIFLLERVGSLFIDVQSKPFLLSDSIRGNCARYWWTVVLNLQTLVNPSDMVGYYHIGVKIGIDKNGLIKLIWLIFFISVHGTLVVCVESVSTHRDDWRGSCGYFQSTKVHRDCLLWLNFGICGRSSLLHCRIQGNKHR
jgi:hypothetical protein